VLFSAHITQEVLVKFVLGFLRQLFHVGMPLLSRLETPILRLVFGNDICVESLGHGG